MKQASVLFSILFVLLSCKKDPASLVKKENVINVKKEKENLKNLPVAEFNQQTVDFGTVDEGEVIVKFFEITNTGINDLIISNAKSTCGCTVPSYPKKPIKSGDSAQIEVRFNTKGKKNKQSKTVTLFTNTLKGKELLTIKGFVTPKNK